MSNAEADELMTQQFAAIGAALGDDAPAVRGAAVGGLAELLGAFWELIPAAVTAGFLKSITGARACLREPMQGVWGIKQPAGTVTQTVMGVVMTSRAASVLQGACCWAAVQPPPRKAYGPLGTHTRQAIRGQASWHRVSKNSPGVAQSTQASCSLTQHTGCAGELAYDEGAGSVRVAAVRATAALVPNPLAAPLLRALLPGLAPLLWDRAVGVRVAMADLLLAVGCACTASSPASAGRSCARCCRAWRRCCRAARWASRWPACFTRAVRNGHALTYRRRFRRVRFPSLVGGRLQAPAVGTQSRALAAGAPQRRYLSVLVAGVTPCLPAQGGAGHELRGRGASGRAAGRAGGRRAAGRRAPAAPAAAHDPAGARGRAGLPGAAAARLAAGRARVLRVSGRRSGCGAPFLALRQCAHVCVTSRALMGRPCTGGMRLLWRAVSPVSCSWGTAVLEVHTRFHSCWQYAKPVSVLVLTWQAQRCRRSSWWRW